MGACSSESAPPEKAPPSAPAPATGVSAAGDYTFLDRYSGQEVTITGTFQSDRAINGVLVLDSGLRITIPHFDLFARGDDWLKYVGHRCSATGILHTWTKDLPSYHGATLQITSFSGSTSE